MARLVKGILPKIAKKALMPFLLLFLAVLLYDIYKLKIAPSLSSSLHKEVQDSFYYKLQLHFAESGRSTFSVV